MPRTKVQPRCREILPSHDLDRIHDVEVVSSTEPWDKSDIRDFLNQHECVGLVIEIPRQAIVGYMLYERTKREIHIHHLMIHPRFRRRKIGSMFIAAIRNHLKEYGRRCASAYVHERLLDVQKFLRSVGFRSVGVMKRYFDEDDAYHMELIEEPECSLSTPETP